MKYSVRKGLFGGAILQVWIGGATLGYWADIPYENAPKSLIQEDTQP